MAQKQSLNVLELFAGIGACSKALENLGIEHEIVDAVEIDKFAIQGFNAIHGTNFEPQDICEWDKDIECDLIMHGSPCQDFSIAGRQAGGDKDSGTRSSLMYETLRIVEKLKPKYVIWENVKNLLSKKHHHNFDAYIEAMSELGYVSKYQVLNAKDYGIPQNRERVFTVSIRDDHKKTVLERIEDFAYFEFPEPFPLEKKLKDVLETEVEEKYYLTDAQVASLTVRRLSQTGEYMTVKNNTKKGYLEAYDGDGVDCSFPTSNTRRGRVQHGLSQTIPASSPCIGVNDQMRIRKLTPRECYRLMGFDDSDFDKASAVLSNTQLYKTAGNSIVVDVLEVILKNLINGGKYADN